MLLPSRSDAVAAGAELRVFDLEVDSPVSLLDDSGGPLPADSIRAIRFGAKGRLFASAGDDKLVKIWTRDSWRCLHTVNSLQMGGSSLALTGTLKFVLLCFLRNHSRELMRYKVFALGILSLFVGYDFWIPSSYL
ncbi:hypothetical protein NE237_011371 [Protea cynaroides]|uniref:Uncharacterized protein n=1 Tax=Protea cynaroides TaxID=273540 RepID=A0A9Q0JY81_9MAGN|nr:hypothetical protein NE237_011371 [Protea cynaroides]